MGSQQIWSKVSEKFAYILVLRGQEVHLFKVTGMSMLLKGKVRKVLDALEQGQDPVEAGGKLVETLDARAIGKAEVAPGNGSLKLYGDGEKPRSISFSTEGSTADEVLKAILDQSGRNFQTEQEDIGVVEALVPPAIFGVLGGLLWLGINQSAGKLAAGEEVEARGRRRAIQELLNWVAGLLGTTGTMILGGVLLALIVGWAGSRLVNRPQRTVWRPQAE